MEHSRNPKFGMLKKPCGNCPFRNDEGAIKLAPGRVEDIIQELLTDDWKSFHCHKTVYSQKGGFHDGDGNYLPSGNEKMCAGAMAVLHKLGRPSIGMRIAMVTNELTTQELDQMALGVLEPEGTASSYLYDEIDN